MKIAVNTSTIVQKLWNYCNVLRDDGMSYGDYVEAAPAHPCARGIRTSCSAQLTYLLFLKMADEPVCVRTRTGRRTNAPYNQKNPVPEKLVCVSNDAGRYSWPSLIKKDGDDLFDHYRHTLEALGNQKGLQ